MVIFPIDQLPYYQNYAFREKFLSAEECDRAVALLRLYPLQDASVRKDDLGRPEEWVRKSRAAIVPWTKDVEWLYQKLATAAIECNKSIFNFQITGFVENFQVDQYEPSHFFDWHQDFGNREVSSRKISIVVQLTDPTQYEGGDLELYVGKGSRKAVRSRGSVMFFPSFVTHRITPVTKGTRVALSGWVSGPSFR